MLENVKYFDFEFYNSYNESTCGRNFYVLYQENSDYFMKLYSFGFNYENESINIQLPSVDGYTIVTDIVPTFTATVTETYSIDDLNSNIWKETYTKGYRSQSTDGHSPNPPKMVMHFFMKSDTAQIIYEDHADIVVRRTTINLTKSSE